MEKEDDSEGEETVNWILCEAESGRVCERSGECIGVSGGGFGRSRADRKRRVEIYRSRDGSDIAETVVELEFKNRSKSGRL